MEMLSVKNRVTEKTFKRLYIDLKQLEKVSVNMKKVKKLAKRNKLKKNVVLKKGTIYPRTVGYYEII